jgi:hypothetical protein
VQSADDRVIDYRISLHGSGIVPAGGDGGESGGPGTPAESRAPVWRRASLVAFTMFPVFPSYTDTSVIHDFHLLG